MTREPRETHETERPIRLMIPGPVPLTTDRASGFYFRKEMEQLLLSPGDVEDIGEDFTVPVDRARIDETVEKALHRITESAGHGGASC